MILKWLHLKYGWVFLVKLSFGLVEAWGRPSEGKQEFLKNCLHQPFKTKKTRFSWVSFLQSYSWKMPLKHKTFRGFTCKTVAKVSIWILCFQYFALTHFHGKSLVMSFSWKCLWKTFWWKTRKMQFEQKLKTRKHKNTFKDI